MNRGPLPGRGETDFVARATDAWMDLPDWVRALAEACNATSQTAVGKAIGYSGSVVSQCLSKTYAGDIDRVADMVRGALLKSVVDCPILGEIGRDRCLSEQREPFRSTSPMRAQLFHACRSGCPFSTLKGD